MKKDIKRMELNNEVNSQIIGIIEIIVNHNNYINSTFIIEGTHEEQAGIAVLKELLDFKLKNFYETLKAIDKIYQNEE